MNWLITTLVKTKEKIALGNKNLNYEESPFSKISGIAFLDNFLNYLMVEKGLSKNTIESYSRDLQKFITYLEKNNRSDISRVTNLEIMSFLVEIKSQGL